MEKEANGLRILLPKVIFALVTAILCIVIQGYFGIIYTETDNFTTSLIVQGYFGNSNFCQTLSPLYCRLVNFICGFEGDTDVFSLSIWIFITIAFLWLIWIAESMTMRFLFFFFCVLLTARFQIFSTNYLITAGFLGAAGAYSLLMAGKKQKAERIVCIVMGLLLFTMGFFLRSAAAMLSLPFAFLGLLYEYVRDPNRKRLISVLTRAGLLFLVFLSLRMEGKLFYGREPYLSASAYSSARATTEDWPMAEYEDLSEPEGFTKSEYQAAVFWMLMDTDTMDTEKLRTIADQGSLISNRLSLKNTGQALKEMAGMVKGETLLLILLTLLLFVGGLFSDLYTRIYCILNVLGTFTILFYYTLRGRAPFRVWAAALFASSFTLLLAETKHRYAEYAVIVVTCVFLTDTMMRQEPHRFVSPFHAKGTGDETMFSDTLRDDIVCVWGGWSTTEDSEGNVRVNNYLGGWYSTICGHFIYQGRLPSKEFIRHNIPVGGWEYGQPYFTEHLQNIGAENPAEGLLDREDMFFVNGNNVPEYMDFMLGYMEEHYGPIEVIDAGEMDGNPVYKLRRVQ